jgi:3-hydroxybutyryl-CoA dehydrogenase
MTLSNVTVLGSGTMGAGIAQTAMMAGLGTTLYDISADIVGKARDGILKRLRGLVERGKATAEAVAAAEAQLTVTHEFERAVAAADYLIEAIPEKLELKRETFRAAERAAPRHCTLGTNTSTLMISAIAEGLQDPSRLIGIHFFNPVPVMRLVEIVMGPQTSATAYEATVALSKRLGKETVRVRESPGFTTSRINALIGNEAFRMLEEGVASASDIDKALKLGLNHPMGPFEMVDLVGLDARLNNLRSLHDALRREVYKPSPLLERLVADGRLGRKSGRGIYRYDAQGALIPGSDEL